MSNGQYGRGISREGVDAAFEADEIRKSDLILQAHLLRERGEGEQSWEKFAEAAAIEERLRDRSAELGLMEKFYVHAFSAAGCWAKAGDFHHALTLCDALLARPELPERLRRRVQEYADAIRAQRNAWFAELLRQTAGAEK